MSPQSGKVLKRESLRMRKQEVRAEECAGQGKARQWRRHEDSEKQRARVRPLLEHKLPSSVLLTSLS